MKRIAGSPTAQHLLALFAFAGLACGMTWPLSAAMGNHILKAKYYWDAYTNTMIMGARVQNALGEGPGGFFDNHFFAPVSNTMALNENLYALSILFAPTYLITDNPLLAYNVVLLLSLTLSAYFTFVLVRRLSGSALAGVVSGTAFAFCPYVFFEIGRIQLVATQWLPLCILFLHRAFESGRFRDILSVAFVYILQVGTCLYYAMFLLPVLVFAGCWLIWQRRRFAFRFWMQVAAAALVAGALLLAISYPYFSMRKHFSLTRSEEIAQGHDGKLSFLLNVSPTNLSLPFLHHEPKKKGAYEEIAFPGFTIALLALIAFLTPLGQALRREPLREQRALVFSFLGVLATAFLAAVGAATVFLTSWASIAVVGCFVVFWKRRAAGSTLFAPDLALYLSLLLLTLLMFLGLEIFTVDGEPVRGLYYYLHNWVPGFDGIRKVSRQAILIMLVAVVLSGYGAALLFRWIKIYWLRLPTLLLLAGLVVFEFRNAPVDLVRVPSGKTVSAAYRWIASQPGKEPVAVIPVNDGLSVYHSFAGLAIHNYFALYHRRRMLNGKSSWVPPVNKYFVNEMSRFPRASGARLLQTLGVKYLVVHGDDLPSIRSKAVIEYLTLENASFKLAKRDGNDYVFEVLPSRDPNTQLIDVPDSPPADAVPVHRWHLTAQAGRQNEKAANAIDGDPNTRWSTGRTQRSGDWFELHLARQERVVAIDFTDNLYTFDAPLSFELSVAEETGTGSEPQWRTVLRREEIRLYRAQVFDPKHFLFRVELPRPEPASRIRFKLLDTIPRARWSIYEATVWVAK